MKNKGLFSILALLVLCVTPARADEPVATDMVYTMNQLKTAIQNYHNVVLCDDIDLTGWETLGNLRTPEYAGTIDGKDHALYNLSTTLLYNTDGATFKNLEIRDCRAELKGDSWNGLIVHLASHTQYHSIVLKNITIEAKGVLCTQRNGILAGDADNCIFSDIMGRELNLASEGDKTGLIAGEADTCTFQRISIMPGCSVFCDGIALIENSAYVGGICGYATGGTFVNCTSGAIVCSNDDCAGGIVGCSKGADFLNCLNNGSVMHVDRDQYDRLVEDIANVITTAGAITTFTGLQGIMMYGYWYWQFENTPLLEAFMKWYANAAVNYVDAGLAGEAVLATSVAMASISAVVLAVSLAVTIYCANEPDEMGGIAGTMYGGSAVNCINLGLVSCKDAYSGGIAGRILSFEDKKDVMHYPSIRNCLNKGVIYGDQQTGGIVGSVCKGATVKGCLNAATVTANSDWGMIYGEKDGTPTITGNSYIAAANGSDAQGTAISTQKLASGQVALDLNALWEDADDQVWRQEVGKDIVPYPTVNADAPKVGIAGNSVNPTVPYDEYVGSLKDFTAAMANPYAHVKLTADIDFGNKYHSFGTDFWPFQGVIDGQGHSLKGIYGKTQYKDNKALGDQDGLFHKTLGAKFSNLNIESCNVWGADFVGALVSESNTTHYSNVNLIGNSSVKCDDYGVGGLVGKSTGDIFMNCYTAPSCTVFSDGFVGLDIEDGISAVADARAGGLAGDVRGSTFVSCVNMADVSGDDDYVGGIAGKAKNSTFNECINGGYIHHLNVDGGDDYLGGIAAFADNCTFTRCVNSAIVRAGDDYVGGIVGYLGNGGSVNRCVNTNLVDGDDTSVGGIVGKVASGEVIYNLNLGSISGSTQDDGYNPSICGVKSDGNMKVNHNYYFTKRHLSDSRQAYFANYKIGDVLYDTGNAANYTNFRANEMIDGTLAESMNSLCGEQIWGTDFAYNAPVPLGTTGMYYSRRVTSTWGTVILPFSVCNSEDVRFYTLSPFSDISNGELTFTAVADGTQVQSNTPMLFKRLTDENNIVMLPAENVYNAMEDICTNIVGQNPNTGMYIAMKGNSVETRQQSTSDKKEYYMAADAFWDAKYQVTIPKNRAWVEYCDPGNSAPSGAPLRIVESASTVTTVDDMFLELEDGNVKLQMYDLWGRPMEPSKQNGIGIVNGKKVIGQ